MESKSTINSTAESWIKISTGRSQLNRSIGSLGPDAASLWPSSLPPSGFSSVSSVLSSTSPGPPPPREDKHLGWLSGILVGLCPVWPRSCGGTSWNLSSPDVKTLKPNEPTGAKPKTNSALPRGHPKARFQQKNLFSYRYSAKKIFNNF